LPKMKIKTVVDLARQHLEDDIIRGSLMPGQQIKEEEVAARLGISRPPVREALKILETGGLIFRKPRRGVFVTRITRKDIWEVYSLKVALYGLSIELAFDRISKDTLKKLEQTVEKMEECVKGDRRDSIRYQKFHEKFHDLIIEVSGHQRLKRIVSILHNQVKRISFASLSDEEHLKESCMYHREILEALKKGDRNGAERFMKEHILKGLKAVNRFVADGEQSEEAPEPLSIQHPAGPDLRVQRRPPDRFGKNHRTTD